MRDSRHGLGRARLAPIDVSNFLLLVPLPTAALGALAYVLLVEAPYAPTGFATSNEVYDMPRVVAQRRRAVG